MVLTLLGFTSQGCLRIKIIGFNKEWWKRSGEDGSPRAAELPQRQHNLTFQPEPLKEQVCLPLFIRRSREGSLT